MHGTRFAQFSTEVLRRGAAAVLPQHLPDHWLDAVLEDAELLAPEACAITGRQPRRDGGTVGFTSHYSEVCAPVYPRDRLHLIILRVNNNSGGSVMREGGPAPIPQRFDPVPHATQ